MAGAVVEQQRRREWHVATCSLCVCIWASGLQNQIYNNERYMVFLLVRAKPLPRCLCAQRLFDYIGGANEDGKKIAMTAPVATGVTPGQGCGLRLHLKCAACAGIPARTVHRAARASMAATCAACLSQPRRAKTRVYVRMARRGQIGAGLVEWVAYV